ncbi:helix-turn-helix transcriptional regulator [Shewanella sp. 1_MG-2023]|uniref:helix-turn-helix domain-containing protein n=1 Tax=unclassified Shewanella TaxID=196818 RepID=UPI000C83D76B|nr:MULTISPECIES: helix-turn-helix transcriptional regulator [unclassified Shewanella]MDO6612984.1 helix-turn-helix transcriptional regulator [Shewanella sp. 7_MG-2023]MDO6772836.1 helix-turn-helix transcriptional regulator [Shewanella sp. 2_MG-2023]MDO6795116.1 helix-turn-helix transcriptional regulator [Shewanella sp. 1_MG-2023]PMG79023.1 transcriptional regulator [Shewanella sp. 10N.286.51.B7]
MASQLDPSSLGELIKDCRKASGMNQEIAASFCGVTKKTLIRVEKGDDVYFSTIIKILNGLGIKLTVNTPNNKVGGSNEWF